MTRCAALCLVLAAFVAGVAIGAVTEAPAAVDECQRDHSSNATTGAAVTGAVLHHMHRQQGRHP